MRRLNNQIPVTTSGRTHPYHPNVRPRLYPRSAKNPSFKVFFPFFVATILVAQEPAVLSNSGEPMRAAYACPEEDLQWAGMSCSEDQPCAIYLELSSVAGIGNKIVAAGNLHSSSATLSSILLESNDSGATWKEPAMRIRGAALDELQFFDAQAGWAAGESQYPLARDPFFLMTTDGGTSWRKQSVAEDDSPGSVLRFWFDSLQHGEAIVDAGTAAAGGRYLSYESETGGGSWTATGGSDKLPKLRHAPLPDATPEWRLAPSKDGKTFQIEQGTKTIAKFLIDVATCGQNSGETR